MIKAIIFDCFGVLTADVWQEFLAALPPETDTDQARTFIHQYDAGLLTLEQFMEQVEESTGQRPVEIENLLHNETTKNTLLLEYIGELKERYKIGLISNIATDWITATFLNTAEQALFDDMVLSYQVGTTKPDPRMYELACDRLDIEPSEAVFIDDILDYCEAARAVGMQAVQYQDFRQMKSELERILAHS